MAHVNGLKLAPDCPELGIPLPMLGQSTFSFVALMYVEAARPGLRDAVKDWRMAFNWHQIGKDWHGLARIGTNWHGLTNW